MIRLLQFIFLGHVHKWKTVRTEQFSSSPSWRKSGEPSRIFIRYTQQCDECGKISHYEAG